LPTISSSSSSLTKLRGPSMGRTPSPPPAERGGGAAATVASPTSFSSGPPGGAPGAVEDTRRGGEAPPSPPLATAAAGGVSAVSEGGSNEAAPTSLLTPQTQPHLTKNPSPQEHSADADWGAHVALEAASFPAAAHPASDVETATSDLGAKNRASPSTSVQGGLL
jgi:hypothetical protein